VSSFAIFGYPKARISLPGLRVKTTWRFSGKPLESIWSLRPRAELYMVGDSAKAFFALLHRQKDAIERELGYPLEWEELPGRDQRIASYLKDVDPKDEEEWPRQHEWLATEASAALIHENVAA